MATSIATFQAILKFCATKNLFKLQISDVKVDDYILVRFTTKSTEKFYIGQMMEMDKKRKRNSYNICLQHYNVE